MLNNESFTRLVGFTICSRSHCLGKPLKTAAMIDSFCKEMCHVSLGASSSVC